MRRAYRIVERTAGNQTAFVVQERIAWCWCDVGGAAFQKLTGARSCIEMLRRDDEPGSDRVVEYHK